MSGLKGGHLEMSQSYQFNKGTSNSFQGQSIDPNNFHQWHKDNMYQSTYSKFHSASSVEPKNTVIPGYGGFVPSTKAENIHARGFSNIAKQSFNDEKLARNVLGLATTGFNVNKAAFVDQSKMGNTSKYGISALQKPHPSWNSSAWRSTTQQFYKNPNHQLNPTYRATDKYLENHNVATKTSGFAVNHAYCDGNGWKPNIVLKGDINRSEYRDRFNKQTPFHRDSYLSLIRKLPHTQTNYKFN